ncbi:RNA polymerase sigma factor [Streptomyces sp. R35]|uniref:RNA polymerase sigma factor n=1 Tax=Streptomyces sp. R35 TaxID=3238630 RepID=A0AB39SIR4_9ACTN
MNDEERFTELYRQHHAAVEAYVARRTDPSSVLDVVANVFLTAWRRFADIPDETELPWLYGVARRTLANDRRAQQRQLSLAELLAVQPPPLNTERQPDDVLVEMDLAKAFDLLDEKDREVLRLALWERISLTQCAQVLECSVPTVRVRLFRARKRLRKHLPDAGAIKFSGDDGRVRRESHA